MAMVATLMVVVILAVMVSIALSAGSGPTPHGTSVANGPTTSTTAASNASQDFRSARVSQCQADYQSLKTALATYRALNGAYPPAGTAWATSSANGGPYLQSWPTDAKHFTISWNGSSLNVVPYRGLAARGSDGSRSPASGCFAA
ncbi:MAG: hypothetical protein ACHQFZ_06120 [Acidimicrobiales bacterium]